VDGTAWQTHGDAPEQGNAIRKIWCLPEDAARCENDSIPPGAETSSLRSGVRGASSMPWAQTCARNRASRCGFMALFSGAWLVLITGRYRSKKGTRVGATAWQRSGTACRPRSRPWLDLPCVLAQEVDRYGPLPTLNCQRAVRTWLSARTQP
jgi:hypothetical protein